MVVGTHFKCFLYDSNAIYFVDVKNKIFSIIQSLSLLHLVGGSRGVGDELYSLS